ncbi:DEAD/DEAH box helicase [Phormidium sp. CLA17]|uniref:DEAD/DEAH box helicase n=1 Tax=Leptolyngbya sp. Cla-17 TaxID=2803751 RepID=UPI001492B2E1|nr:DEAD/DEAH box helicase [Leptolyngbya sp. Cla-17]MBM0741333.1 DEAD/DEAH box helicase [Leptolyngbya sp. Cla-17]
MNPIRGIARRITRVASGVRPAETYPVSGWIIQSPSIISPTFRLFDTLVSDDLCLVMATSKPSANLLPKRPATYEVLQPCTTPKIFGSSKIKVTVPAIFELTDWLIEAVACSQAYVKLFIAPETFTEKITNFEVSVLAELEYLLVSLDVSQILENSFVAFERPGILKCCFGQDDDEEELKQYEDFSKEQNNEHESKDKILSQSLSYCEILHPILLPPLSLEVHNDLDFYNPLRGYQKQGIRFLFDTPSALLADEMGTGKTVQAVNALRLLFRQAHIKSVLVVCPSAVIGSVDLSIKTGNSEGWSGHFYHWAPELLVAVMRGGKKEQRKLDWQKPFHVYITTYATLRIDLNDDVLTNLQQFDCIILDEAQTVKNRETKTAKAIRRLQADYRWALTGTPIENRLDDVISLFDFIRPGTFRGGVQYSSQDVSNAIKSFMLRRLKQDVLQDLPDKERQEAWLDLDDAQRNAYNQALHTGRHKIETSLDGKQTFQIKRHIFALLAELKQICNFAKEQITSPKTYLLLELLETIAANHKKVLVFSQYRSEGTDKIAHLLSQTEIGYVFYKGSPQQREQAKSDFKSKPEITVFLATFGTASEGLTLIEATYVINFDHLWNPAKMNQAEDRIHRIGQTKGVTIYSFWMKNTIEERIKKKLIDKRILIDNTINSLATGVSEDELFSTEDWLDIFDIKLTKKTVDVQANAMKLSKKSDPKIQAKRFAAQLTFQNNQNKLSPPTASSHIIHVLENIKQMLKTMADSPHHIFHIQGNYIEKSVKELTLMSEQPPIFNQQGATIGVNYAAKDSNPKIIQNVQNTQQSSPEMALAVVVQIIQALEQKYTFVQDEQQALSIIDVKFKDIKAKQLPQWQDLMSIKRLWNGGKKATVKVGEHFTESNPWGKGLVAFLEGVSEDVK